MRSDTVYKVCAIVGTLIVAAVPYSGWRYVTTLEDKATSIFEQRILARLDLESLKTQFGSLQSAIESGEADPADPDSTDYTRTQTQHLLKESETIDTQIEQTIAQLKRLETAKNSLVLEIKLLFAGVLLATVVGMVVAIFGFAGWYFHVRIFPERRSAPRDETRPYR